MFMKKKLMLIGSLFLCGFVATEVAAQPLICPFTDFFTIQGSSDTVIKNLVTDGNLNGTLTNETHFTTSCKSNSSTGNGHVYLTVGRGSAVCDLIILDGPFESNPRVENSYCVGGLQYSGMDHAKGTYNYTLKFV